MKKKKMILIGLTLLSLAGFSRAESSLKLGEQDGLTEQCEVRDYDAEKGIVRLMTGGVMTNCPFSSFSSDAQYKITGWAADKNFRSSSGLRINIRENKRTSKVDERFPGFQEITRMGKQSSISYVVTVENQSSSMIKDVIAEYRIFFTEREGAHENKKCLAGKVIFDIAPGEKKTFSTRAVYIRDYKTITEYPESLVLPFDGGGSFVKTKDQLKGVHIQFSKVRWDGVIAERSAKKGYIPPESSWDDYAPISTTQEGKFPFGTRMLQES